jgi:hypothetical protein
VGSDPTNIPIAITGMHRSGTSMVTRALHDSGLHLIGSGAEELIDAAEDNPEGFWENKAIVACNDELLEATGGSWDNPPALPPQAVDDARVAHIAEPATAAIAGLSEHDHWGFKDPRLCLTASYWLDLVPDLRFIICVRHPLEVALSLKRRNQNSYSLGLALWERYYATVLARVPRDHRIVTHYDTFFSDPEGEIARLCAFAGLDAAPPRVRSDLRHHTIGVGLTDAGASPSLRALYADLCREAGAPVAPEQPADEGRVRRLILDGAVAERHAEQRQAAIDRLEEREAELRGQFQERERQSRDRVQELERQLRDRVQELERDRVAAEAEHRARVGDLEIQLAAARLDAAERADAIRLLGEAVARTEKAIAVVNQAVAPGPVKRAARRSVGKAVREGRRIASKGRTRAVPAASAAAHQLPPPAQQQLRRARNLVHRGIDDPVPTAKSLARRLLPPARAAAKRLPPPAQQSLRRGRTRVRRAVSAPVPTAKAVVRRLPPGAQQAARRGWVVGLRIRRELRSPAAPRGNVRPGAAAPKGPAFREWKDGYEAMVGAAVPGGQPWLVVLPGSPAGVRDARTPKATPFPDTNKGQPFDDDLSHIAHLEALRVRGHRYLVLPEGSRPWFRRQAELRDHVSRTYRTVADNEGAGAVFDLATSAVAGSRSLRGEVSRIAAGLPTAPAVLDWTDLDVAAELPGLATFRPPLGDVLPYLDASVDVVVVDEEHDLAEARRVAATGVITVSGGASGVEVTAVVVVGANDGVGGSVPAAPSVLVWSSAAADNSWRSHLAARVAEAGADLRFAEIDAAGPATVAGYDVVVVVEPGVLPLPGAIEAAALLAAARPASAIAGKVLTPDGRIEAAGGIVFFDRSVALIAEASTEVRAPWHDFVRPVCWAPGLVAAAASLWAGVTGPAVLTGRPFLREWCAEVWARGGSVVYQPTVTAVRVAGNGTEASIPLQASSWQRVLDLRPARPGDLSDGAWRYLLAHDDVEACRG